MLAEILGSIGVVGLGKLQRDIVLISMLGVVRFYQRCRGSRVSRIIRIIRIIRVTRVIRV